MKHVILLFVFTSFMRTALKAQQWAEIGTKWYYDMSGDGTAPSNNTQYSLYESVADTMLLGESCKKIKRLYYRWSNCDTVELTPLFTFMRNDTVYMSQDGRPFYTMYVMNAQVDDTFVLSEFRFTYTVDSIRTFMLNGTALKQFYLSSPVFVDSYIEQIGSIRTVLENFASGIPERPGPIRCFENSFGAVNFNPSVACIERKCNTYSLNVLKSSSNFSVYPNPAKGLVNIHAENEVILDVYDIQGRVLQSYRISSGLQTLLLEALSNGLYLLHFRDKNGINGMEILSIQR